MTDSEIRICIAEACGGIQRLHVVGAWTAEYPTGNYVIYDEHNDIVASSVPDYLNDLNAMHEAVMLQDVTTRDRINCQLFEILDPQKAFIIDRVVNATARQRAEAFLRTIGKWKD